MAKKAKITSEELTELIVDILNRCSGGCKFLELQTALLARARNTGLDFSKLTPEILERHIKAVALSQPTVLGYVEYTWRDANRWKMFIFTP